MTHLPRLPLAPLALALSVGVLALGCSDTAAPPGDAVDAGAATDAAKVCVPTLPSSADSYAIERAPGSAEVTLARAIADRYITEHPPATLRWDWGDGVLLAAMVELRRVTGDDAYRAYAASWLDGQIATGYNVFMSDRCPPADAAIALHGETCDPKYRAVVDAVETYLYDEAKRTPDGGISHLGTLAGATPQLWIDSLFMFGEVLVRAGEAYGETRALDTYDAQHLIFAHDLQDATTGLFTHAAYSGLAQDAGVFWGRGNGWVAAVASDYLRVRKLRGESADAVLASFRALATGIVATQDATTGLWWSVVSRPGETYLETSAAALFALGLARGYRAGALDASVLPVVHKALTGVRSRIVDDAQGRPVVTGTSGPTSVGDFASYAKVAQKDDLSYGVGAVILALVEASGLP